MGRFAEICIGAVRTVCLLVLIRVSGVGLASVHTIDMRTFVSSSWMLSATDAGSCIVVS